MSRTFYNITSLIISFCGILFVGSCQSGGILSGEAPVNLNGVWVDSFVTIHVNDMPEVWGEEPSESLVITHVSKLQLFNGEFTLEVTPRVFIGWPGFVSGYDTLSIERDGSFTISGDTLILAFNDEHESPPEILHYEINGDSLIINFLFSGSEISPGLWESKESSYIWDGHRSKDEGIFKKSQ